MHACVFASTPYTSSLHVPVFGALEDKAKAHALALEGAVEVATLQCSWRAVEA